MDKTEMDVVEYKSVVARSRRARQFRPGDCVVFLDSRRKPVYVNSTTQLTATVVRVTRARVVCQWAQPPTHRIVTCRKFPECLRVVGRDGAAC